MGVGEVWTFSRFSRRRERSGFWKAMLEVQRDTSLVVEVSGPLRELAQERKYKRMTGVWDSSKSFCIAVIMGEKA